MTPDELVIFRSAHNDAHGSLLEYSDGLESAPTDRESENHAADALAEALFLRAFTAYEAALETLFFHYVTGGVSLQGASAPSRLRACEVPIARAIVKGGNKFLSWAKPSAIRDLVTTYIDNGWPIIDMLATKADELADCERLRNRIAHRSPEADQQFKVVQRNLLGTERLFSITPGQLLRARHRKHKVLVLRRYLDVMGETILAITDPPA